MRAVNTENTLRRLTVEGLLLFLVVCCALPVHGQAGDLFKGFKLIEPASGKSRTNLFKSQIIGAEALPLTNGLVLVRKGVKIQSLLDDGTTNLVATAPDCIVDYKRSAAYSASRLEVQTANGQLRVEGQGFFYLQTNANLTISNEVQTTVDRNLIRSTNNAPGLPFIANTNGPPGRHQQLKIFSDHFLLESASNLVIYSGHVRVDDPQMDLICEALTIRRAPNGSLENVLAEQNVFLTNKLDRSWASGERAHWQDVDGQRQSKAGTFIFDRRANTLMAEHQPSIRLPHSTLNQPDWLLNAQAPALPRSGPTNGYVEITAEQMTIQLPGTNQPSRRLTADNQVLIVSPADHSSARSDQAVYDEGAATLQLAGHAVWESDQRLVKGERLVMDRTNQVFSVQGNAYLKMPLSSIGRSPVSAGLTKPTTMEMVEVFSDHFVYEPSALRFYEQVRANYLEDQALRGWLTCAYLGLGLVSNRLENVSAERNVTAEQLPFGTNQARQIDKKLNCESLNIRFYTNGLLETVLAQTNVFARQTETPRGRTFSIKTELRAERAWFSFSQTTNQLREFVAETNVSILQEARSAHGARAVYTASNDLVKLSGNPTAETPLGRITEAEVLIWDHAHNSLKAKGPKVMGQGQGPARGTNSINRLFRK